MSTGSTIVSLGRQQTLLSFERPPCETRMLRASMKLENCTIANIFLK